MQPIARDGLTAEQIVEVVGSPQITVSVGLELLTDDGWRDVSQWLVPGGSFVERGSYRTIHASCELRLTERLNWGIDRVRPFMILESNWGRFRANLGVYVLSTPGTTVGRSPTVWEVEGYDLLEVLNHPHGYTHVVPAGAGYLASAKALVDEFDLDVVIEAPVAGGDIPLPSTRVWPIDEETTTLNIVNSLLEAVGHRALWADWNGILRAEPYRAPANQGREWTYNSQHPRTTVAPTRTLIADFFEAPNRWVFVRDDPESGPPVAGDGLYEVNNVDDGLTSQVARGRIITRVAMLESASQNALVSQGDRMVDSDKRIAEVLEIQAGPNPLHWHFDVIQVEDMDLSVSGRFVVRTWKLPLDGNDMTMDARAV